MKKLITIIMILALLLPVAALAEDPDLAGCWVAFIPTSVSIGYGNFAYILVLNEDGSMVELQTSSNSAERTLTALTTRAQWFYYDGKVYIRDEHGNAGFQLDPDELCR